MPPRNTWGEVSTLVAGYLSMFFVAPVGVDHSVHSRSVLGMYNIMGMPVCHTILMRGQ